MLRKVPTYMYLSVDAGPLLTDKLEQFLMKCDSPKRLGVVVQVNSCITVLPPGVGRGGGGRGGTEVMMVVVILLVAVIIIMVVVWRRRTSGVFVVVIGSFWQL